MSTEALAYPLPRPSRLAPPDLYAALRTERPIVEVTMEDGGMASLLTRYSDVRAALGDRRFSMFPPGFDPAINPAMSNPFHTGNVRPTFARFVTRAYLEAVRTRSKELAAQLLDEMAARKGSADLVRSLSMPLPLTIIAEMIGVPLEELKQLRSHVDATAGGKVKSPEEIGQAWDEMLAYVTRLVAGNSRDHHLDLISRLRTAEETSGLGDEQLGHIALGLLLAGYMSTAHAISIGTMRLLAGDGFQRLSSEPALAETAVEEILRVQAGPGGEAFPRFAQEDLELDGINFRAGDRIIPSLEAANHDPAVFDDPDHFDIERQPNRHLAFGYGQYHCLGSAMARVMLREVFLSLPTRFPHLRMDASLEAIPWMTVLMDAGPASLPVSWQRSI
jgi:cytochrome P450